MRFEVALSAQSIYEFNETAAQFKIFVSSECSANLKTQLDYGVARLHRVNWNVLLLGLETGNNLPLYSLGGFSTGESLALWIKYSSI
jgi:hypothetical protein